MSHLFIKSSIRAYVLTKTANLLTYTQATDNAAWTKTNCTSVDGATDPVSGTAAETVTATNSKRHADAIANATGRDLHFSVYLKTKDRDGECVHFRGWVDMGGQGYYRVLDQMGNQPVHFCRHRNPGDQDCDQCGRGICLWRATRIRQ